MSGTREAGVSREHCERGAAPTRLGREDVAGALRGTEAGLGHEGAGYRREGLGEWRTYRAVPAPGWRRWAS